MLALDKDTLVPDLSNNSWCQELDRFSTPLYNLFNRVIRENYAESAWKAYAYEAVNGLESLATFPGSLVSVSKLTYQAILQTLVSIIKSNFNETFLWKSALKVLVEISLHISKHLEDENEASFNDAVMQRIVRLFSSDDWHIPLSLKLEALFDIGMTRKSFMLSAITELEKTTSNKLFEIFVSENVDLAELTTGLLECYSTKVLPWCHCHEAADEVSCNLAVVIFSGMKSTSLSLGLKGNVFLGTTMAAMKQGVAGCSVKNQEKVLQKAINVLATCSFFPSSDLILEGDLFSKKIQLGQTFNGLSLRDEWILSLFTSAVIALRPQTRVPNIRLLLKFFTAASFEGHIPSAQAIGSLVNKLPSDILDYSSLEEFIEMWCSFSVGLAWLGKGLLMRGHNMLKDVGMAFLSCLVSGGDHVNFRLFEDQTRIGTEQEVLCLRKSAADAFLILMSDSDACLNENYHASACALYKQQFFNIMMPMFLSAIEKCDSPTTRCFL